MISVGLSVRVASHRARVWSALVEPEQALTWRPGQLRSLDAEARWPVAGRAVRFRCHVRGLPLVLHETPVEIRPGARLRLRQALGPLRCESTWALADEPEGNATRVALRIAAANEVPLLGGVLDRFGVRTLVTELLSDRLDALCGWCERGEASGAGLLGGAPVRALGGAAAPRRREMPRPVKPPLTGLDG